jgi:transcription antitermination protein NusB
MGKRRKVRESALQVLFQLEFDESSPDQSLEKYWADRKSSADEKDGISRLVTGVMTHREAIDHAIQAVSEHWRMSRMVLVDRNILRIAAFEMMFDEDLAPAIVINEAIEIAKKYSGERSAVFINGVLDALKQKLKSDAENTKDEKDGRETT